MTDPPNKELGLDKVSHLVRRTRPLPNDYRKKARFGCRAARSKPRKIWWNIKQFAFAAMEDVKESDSGTPACLAACVYWTLLAG
ncbi:MAG: hypothetical protein JO166_18010 [Deltaproteobacteria bacterium]|nr:hypothetical protein [Deltaproteobacteria bacterium]